MSSAGSRKTPPSWRPAKATHASKVSSYKHQPSHLQVTQRKHTQQKSFNIGYELQVEEKRDVLSSCSYASTLSPSCLCASSSPPCLISWTWPASHWVILHRWKTKRSSAKKKGEGKHTPRICQPKGAQLVVVDHSQQTLDQETHVTPALYRRGYLLQLGGQRLNLFLVGLLSLVGLTSEG